MQAGAKAGEALSGLDELLGGSEGALAQLRTAARRIERGAADHPLLAEALASLDRALIEASEAEDRIGRAAEALAFDPARLEAVEARLFDIRGLARKHRVEPDALAALGEELTAKLALIEAGGERIAELEAELADARARYDQAAQLLRQGRTEAAARLDAAVAGELAPLKLDAARFRTALGEAEPGPAGIDRVEFEVSTNPGAPFGPLTRIASGGELSRFILALKVSLAEAGTAQTMIFDEIDRGVGGAVASAIGERLARLAQKSQLLVVTHSPQVAARAAHHYRIEKAHDGDITRTKVRKLTLGRAARGNRPNAVGLRNHRRSPRPGGAAIGGSMTEQRSLKQEYNGQTLDHVIVHDETGRVLPTVIIIPTVMGVQPLEIGFAERLVPLGYHVVIADLFGRRFTPGVDKEAAFAAMGELARGPGGAARSAARHPRRGSGAGTCRRQQGRSHRLLLRRAVRARRGAVRRGCRRRRCLPWPVRSVRPACPADQGQGRRLSWLG